MPNPRNHRTRSGETLSSARPEVRTGSSGTTAGYASRHGAAVTSAQLGIVDGPDHDPAGERVALGIEAFALLDLPVPPDFGAPGSRRQILVDAGRGVVAYTVAAVAASGSGEVVQMSNAALGRLLLDEPPRSSVDVTADILGRCELVETAVLRSCANVAVIAPHGGSIERATGAQAERVASDGRFRADSWICEGPGGGAFRRWHITSDDLSEGSFAGLRALLGSPHDLAVSFHGFSDIAGLDVIVGGLLDDEVRRRVRDELERRLTAVLGRPAIVLLAMSGNDPHPGRARDNVVNRLAALGGLQIEQGLVLRSTRDAPGVVADVVSDWLATLAPLTPSEGPWGKSPAGQLAYDDE
jgi:phage replication-related protein YjqB (UPF0714/DUF867 family)